MKWSPKLSLSPPSPHKFYQVAPSAHLYSWVESDSECPTQENNAIQQKQQQHSFTPVTTTPPCLTRNYKCKISENRFLLHCYKCTFSLAVSSVHTITDIALATQALVASSRVHTLLAAHTECLTLINVQTLPSVHRQSKTVPAETHHTSVDHGTVLFTASIYDITRFVSSTLGENSTEWLSFLWWVRTAWRSLTKFFKFVGYNLF